MINEIQTSDSVLVKRLSSLLETRCFATLLTRGDKLCRFVMCLPWTRPRQVLQLGGIPVLVSLLRSSNPAVGQAAAGALRNLVFKHQANKQQVQECGGIGKALQLLKETDSTETQKQITGRPFFILSNVFTDYSCYCASNLFFPCL